MTDSRAAGGRPEPGGGALRPPAGEGELFRPINQGRMSEVIVEQIRLLIRRGRLTPGDRLPAERELCEQLGIARSTLRQALTALVQSGYLHAVRGRGGGTFVADALPPADPPSAELERSRMAREAFGDEVVDHYLNYGRTEQRLFDEVVTCYERERMFERG